ncbi:MAG TPA: DUF998 domain-containing protein [Candidatus Dormibacteraeota bacterium]|nr:DUF998 domain-containing protein [Candidatus Dormibacteraeota bacterium]
MSACTPSARITRSLLGYGVLAGPLYVVVALVQAALRPGFDLLHDDVSLLANGAWGWVQVLNFVVTGACVAAFAVGAARALAGRPAGTWAPRLLALYAVGLIAAGIFVADPMNGFPAGAPAGRPETISVHGLLHIAAAGVGFIGLVAACFVMARRFASERRRAWVAFSIITGVVFLVAFAAIASGSSSAVVVVGFWAALLLAWSWMAAVAIDLYRQA